jgi:enterochelin esterase family protein
MAHMTRQSLLMMVAFAPVWLLAQTPVAPAQAVKMGPEVHADGTVTFRFRAPNAKEVFLSREGAQKLAMERDESGVWSVTTGALEPDYYGYTYAVDGVGTVDPVNPLFKPNLLSLSSMVHVPGPAGTPWELTDVPHGEVHRHFYHSGIIGDDRDFYIYTPPGYEHGRTSYPVLYLLHGYSDDASGWTAVGRANIILDNLIAQGKAKPMLIVMTLGYGVPAIVTSGLRDPGMRDKNYNLYRDALFNEVIPKVESDYRVEKNRASRAIAGLSMGGAESLYIGLNAIDRFAWVGAFSAGGSSEDYASTYPKLDAKTAGQLRLLWIACGTDDRLIEPNRKFREWLRGKDIHPVEIETPGAHVWMVWRRNLANFAPLLFQK